MDMKKQLLAGAAALALMSGAAFAQTVVETTRSTTVTPVPPPAQSYTSSRTETSGFGGAAIEKKQTFESGPNGTVSSTENKVVRPDGSSETSYRKDWSTTPAPAPAPVMPYSSTTTTTTTR
jgi:hypothetical protein